MPTRPRAQVKSLFDVLGSPTIKPTFKAEAGGYYAPKRNTGIGSDLEQFGKALESFGAEASAFAIRGLKQERKEDLEKGARIFERNQYKLLKEGNQAFAYAEKNNLIKSDDRKDVIRGFRIRQGQLFAQSSAVKDLLAEDMAETIDNWTNEGVDKRQFNSNINDLFNNKLKGLYNSLPDNYWARDIGFMGAIQKQLNVSRDEWNQKYKEVLDEKNVTATAAIMGDLLKYDMHAAVEFFFEGSTVPEGAHPDFERISLMDTLSAPVPELVRFRGHAPVDILPAKLGRRTRLYQYWGNHVMETLVDNEAPENIYNVPLLTQLINQTDEWRALSRNGARLDEGDIKKHYIQLKKDLYTMLDTARSRGANKDKAVSEASREHIETLASYFTVQTEGKQRVVKYLTTDPHGKPIERIVPVGDFDQKEMLYFINNYQDSKLWIPGKEDAERLMFHPTDVEFFFNEEGIKTKSENFGKTDKSFLPTLAMMRKMQDDRFSLKILQDHASQVRQDVSGTRAAGEAAIDLSREEFMRNVASPAINAGIRDLAERANIGVLSLKDIKDVTTSQYDTLKNNHPDLTKLYTRMEFSQDLMKAVSSGVLGKFMAKEMTVGGLAMEQELMEKFKDWFGMNELTLKVKLRDKFPNATEEERNAVIPMLLRGDEGAFSFLEFRKSTSQGTSWRNLIQDTLLTDATGLANFLGVEKRDKNRGLQPWKGAKESEAQRELDARLLEFMDNEVEPILRNILSNAGWDSRAIDPTHLRKLFTERTNKPVHVHNKAGDNLTDKNEAGVPQGITSLYYRFKELGTKDVRGNVKYKNWTEKLQLEIVDPEGERK